MNKDQLIGMSIFIASIVGIIIYGWLIFFIAPQLVLQVSAFIAIAIILGIMAWIGYTLATTPPPAPIEAEPPLEEIRSTQEKPQE
ncbi:MAG: hypothetical protein QW372_01880 [Nitrososphaerales archaeon]